MKPAPAPHSQAKGSARGRSPGAHADLAAFDLGLQPEVPLNAWALDVDGLVAHPAHWDWSAFKAQPQSDLVTDIHCVTAWSRYDNDWRGDIHNDQGIFRFNTRESPNSTVKDVIEGGWFQPPNDPQHIPHT